MNNCKKILILICIILQYSNTFCMLPNGIMPFDPNQLNLIFESDRKKEEIEKNYKKEVSKNTEDFYQFLLEDPAIVVCYLENGRLFLKNGRLSIIEECSKDLFCFLKSDGDIKYIILNIYNDYAKFLIKESKKSFFKDLNDYKNLIYDNFVLYNKNKNISYYKISSNYQKKPKNKYQVVQIQLNKMFSFYFSSIFFNRKKLIESYKDNIHRNIFNTFLIMDLKYFLTKYNELYKKFNNKEIFFKIYGDFVIPYELKLSKFKDLFEDLMSFKLFSELSFVLKLVSPEDNLRMMQIKNIAQKLQDKEYTRFKAVTKEIIKFY